VRLVILLGLLTLSHRACAAISAKEWHHTTIHGHPIYYAVLGHGSPRLLLHGGGESGEQSFEHQIDAFARHHLLVVPDQIGQGRTPDAKGALTYTGMAEDTAALLRHLKLRHVEVVGFSDGGILALMLAAYHPELVRRLVVSGVNIAPGGMNADDLEDLGATQSPNPRTIDEKLARLWYTSPTKSELSEAILSTIKQPVLVISGDRDAIRLEHTLKIFHALPNAELCVLPDTDHGTFAERPAWLNPIVDTFLNGRQSTINPEYGDLRVGP
jgi:pimeloyl-ACP methyl ester carboxylesterase